MCCSPLTATHAPAAAFRRLAPDDEQHRDEPKPRVHVKPKVLVGAGIAVIVVIAATGVAIAASGGGTKHPAGVGSTKGDAAVTTGVRP